VQAWAFLRSFGGQVISGVLTKSTPSFLQRPKTHTLIVLASWAAVNYSKDDRFFRVINRRWGRVRPPHTHAHMHTHSAAAAAAARSC
jgi:hypothetical protein